MNTGKQTAKTKKAAKQLVAAKLNKKNATKVVEVKLHGDAKKKEAAVRAKARDAASQKKPQKRVEKETRKKLAESSIKQKPAAVKQKTAPVAEPQAADMSAMQELLNPSPRILKTFRDAAKHSRKLLRETKRAVKGSFRFLAKPPQKAKGYLFDLRLHSPASHGYFSPGGVEPISAIVRLAKVKGLQMIGLTDYYNASYVDQIKLKALEAGITVLPGIDLRCEVAGCTEIYITVLFPEQTTGADLFALLDELRVPGSAYGSGGYVISLPFAQVVQTIEARQGLIIPTRVDKTPYRQLAIQTLVETFGFHAFDLVHPENPEFFRRNWPAGEFTFFSFSNANALGQIGNRAVKVKLSTLDYQGLKERVQRRVA